MYKVHGEEINAGFALWKLNGAQTESIYMTYWLLEAACKIRADADTYPDASYMLSVIKLYKQRVTGKLNSLMPLLEVAFNTASAVPATRDSPDMFNFNGEVVERALRNIYDSERDFMILKSSVDVKQRLEQGVWPLENGEIYLQDDDTLRLHQVLNAHSLQEMHTKLQAVANQEGKYYEPIAFTRIMLPRDMEKVHVEMLTNAGTVLRAVEVLVHAPTLSTLDTDALADIEKVLNHRRGDDDGMTSTTLRPDEVLDCLIRKCKRMYSQLNVTEEYLDTMIMRLEVTTLRKPTPTTNAISKYSVLLSHIARRHVRTLYGEEELPVSRKTLEQFAALLLAMGEEHAYNVHECRLIDAILSREPDRSMEQQILDIIDAVNGLHENYHDTVTTPSRRTEVGTLPIRLNMLRVGDYDSDEGEVQEQDSALQTEDSAQDTDVPDNKAIFLEDRVDVAYRIWEEAHAVALASPNDPLQIHAQLNRIDSVIKSCTNALGSPLKYGQKARVANLKQQCEDTRQSLQATLRRISHLDVTHATPVISFTGSREEQVGQDSARERDFVSVTRRNTLFISPDRTGAPDRSIEDEATSDKELQKQMLERLHMIEQQLRDTQAQLSHERAKTNTGLEFIQPQTTPVQTIEWNVPAAKSLQPRAALGGGEKFSRRDTMSLQPTTTIDGSRHSIMPSLVPPGQRYPTYGDGIAVHNSAPSIGDDQDAHSTYIQSLLTSTTLAEYTEEQQSLIIEAAHSGMLGSRPKELVKWLEANTGKKMKAAVPNTTVDRALKDLFSATEGPAPIPVLDCETMINPAGSLRTVLPQPEVVWGYIENVKDQCREYGFVYLFNCISIGPKHQLYPANLQLIRSFFNDELGTHVARFNAVMARWIRNLPKRRQSSDVNDLRFTGSDIMERFYAHLIQRFFSKGEEKMTEYFHARIKKIDVGKQKLETTLNMLTDIYNMHLFIAGELTESDFEDITKLLQRRFNAYAGTVEEQMVIKWPDSHTTYSKIKQEDPSEDVFTRMITKLRDLSYSYPERQTAYEFCQARRKVDNTGSSRGVHFPSQHVETNTYDSKRRYSRSPVRVNTAMADDGSAQEKRDKIKPEPCPCGRTGHLKANCHLKHTWPMTPEEIDRATYQVQQPSNQNFRAKEATALSTLRQPSRGGRGGRGGYNNRQHLCLGATAKRLLQRRLLQPTSRRGPWRPC